MAIDVYGFTGCFFVRMFTGYLGKPQLRPNYKSNLEMKMGSEKRSVIRSKCYVWAEIISSTYDLTTVSFKSSFIFKLYFEQIVEWKAQ